MSPLLPFSQPSDHDGVAQAMALVKLFCESVESFGQFCAVESANVPQPWRQLLDHESHMTVAMEKFYKTTVSLQVVAELKPPATSAADCDWYAREIFLLHPDGAAIQYGIVRIDLSQVDTATAQAILRAHLPLGRILLEAGLLLQVQHVQLMELLPSVYWQALFSATHTHLQTQARTFGRVASIRVAGKQAVDLLEIVAPPLTGDQSIVGREFPQP